MHDGSDTTTASFEVSVEDGNEDGSTPAASTFNLHGHAGQRPAGADRRSCRHGPRRRQLRARRRRPRLHRCRTMCTRSPSRSRRRVNGQVCVGATAGDELHRAASSQPGRSASCMTAARPRRPRSRFRSRTATRTARRRPPAPSTFTVTPANDPPVLTGDLAATVPEGGSYVLTASDLGFTDADDDEVTFTVSAASNGQVFVGTTAVTSFTAASSQPGRSASCITAARPRRPRSRFRSRTATRTARRRPPAPSTSRSRRPTTRRC